MSHRARFAVGVERDRARLAIAVAVALGLLVTGGAVASNVARMVNQNAAVATKRYCAGYAGAKVSVQCSTTVWVATGQKLTDGGTKATSDGGQPITPDRFSDTAIFPGDPYPVDLGPSEKCIAVLAADPGDGGSWCTFFERNNP